MVRSLYLMVAVLQVLAFGTILCKIDVTEREKRDLSEDDLTVLNLFNSSQGILVGEETPIWSASYYESDEKIHILPASFDFSMKDVMKRYRAGKYKIKPTVPSRRSVDESVSNIVKNIENGDIETLSTSSTRDVGGQISVVKRDTTNDTHYLSILIVMYDERTEQPSYTTFVDYNVVYYYYYDKIIESLAFWNDVNLQLRHLRNPRVRLRIAGIIFGYDVRTINYLWGGHVDSWHDFNSQDAVQSLVQHWRAWQPPLNHWDTGKLHFDIVVAETEPSPSAYKAWSYEVSSGPLCTDDTVRPAAGLLLQHKKQFGFESIQQAVQGIAKILGAKTDESCLADYNDVMAENVLYTSIGRKWSECTLDQISANLRADGSCLRNIDESFPPGKPIEAILPGKLLPPLEYCRMSGYDEPIYSMEDLQCNNMNCANERPLSTWQSIPILDGTTCDEGKVCLDEKCVSDTILNVV